MSVVMAVVRKELILYFTSFVFYGLAGVFLVLSGYYFYTNLEFFVLMGGMDLARGLWQYEFIDMQQRLLVLVPLLTMRLFAEERKLGTLELLWTYPVRDGEIIVGKFLACVMVVTLLIAATALYPLTLTLVTPVDAGPLVAGYLGLVLLAAAFVACGLFLSAVTDSQLIAGAATYGVLLVLWALTWNEAALGASTLRALAPLSLFDRFHPFASGAVDTKNVVYFLLFMVTFLSLAFFALDARRWRGLR